jgi:hypothetical protein
MCMHMRGCGASHVELQILFVGEAAWNGPPERVRVPYPKRRELRDGPQVPRDTRNPVGIREDHLPRLNTPWRPIVNQYREGKVKSTPGGE